VSPTVLVAATSHWFTTARLAIAFADAGCSVEAVCPPRHPLRVTSAVRRTHAYRALTPLTSFAKAITVAAPDLVIPGDDLASCHLYFLYLRERGLGRAEEKICAVIKRSLGAPESFPVIYQRTKFMDLAQEEGIRAPKTQVIANLDDLRKWVAQKGFPTVLKADGTSSGEGVRVVPTLEHAEHAFRALQAPPLLARAAKRALLDQDRTLVWPSLFRRRSIVNAQTYVAGREATSTIACWKGTVLAGLHFEVVSKQREAAGPASVIRLIDHPEISIACEKVCRRLNLSGVHGLDFMLEERTEDAYLIEMNPRATQVGHLTLGPGRDLPAALCAAVSGETVREAPKATENDTIALFPQEWTNNPASPFLRSAYHDIPWQEPELIRACVRKRRNWTAWYSRRRLIQVLLAAFLPRL
jgi:hypothetical protein